MLAVLVAAALFTRFSLDDNLSRDESVYAYGGQQLAGGTAPYASIFDPKTPLSTFVAGAAVAAARAIGAGEVSTIRIVFFGCEVLTVLAIYALGFLLWDSVLAALGAAVALASFQGFASAALGGPDPKAPGILFSVVAMALLVRRHWFWGALAGSLACLAWQPLAIFWLLAVAGAWLMTDSPQRRAAVLQALAGAAIPFAAAALYFALAGELHALIEGVATYPLTGISRPPETVTARAHRILRVADAGNGPGTVVFWVGLATMIGVAAVRVARAWPRLGALLKDPFLVIVIASGMALAAYSLLDFQQYGDLFPAVPYATLGAGGAVGLAVRAPLRGRAAAAAPIAAVVSILAVIGASWAVYSHPRQSDTDLLRQRAQASAIERLLNPGESLYVLGDPTALVLTGRRNPDRFIYLRFGIARWKVLHTRGGMAGWQAQIRAADPGIIVFDGSGWTGPVQDRLLRFLRSRYAPVRLGDLDLLVKPAVRARAAPRQVALSG